MRPRNEGSRRNRNPGSGSRVAHWFLNKFRKTDAREPLAGGRSVRAGTAFPARLTFEDVDKRYGERSAVTGFSLDLAPGEVLCLLGPSGCGKTTLLRLAAGIERPTSGRILINDLEVAGPAAFVQPEARGVGLMFQDFALFPHLTILDNVAFGLKALPADVARQEALRMLSRVGLERYGDQYPHILSGGQQQRVALARAIVPRPAVMLMDEPFSGLDVQLRDAMQEETLALIRETQATSIIVTHNPEEAMRIGDRIVVMRAGRLVQAGTAEDLYRRPAELFVARLFSEINEVPAKVSGGRIATPIGVLAAPGLAEGAAATYCIRERSVHLAPADEQGRDDGEGLRGRVLTRKFLGDAVRFEVAVEGLDMPLHVRANGRGDVAPGREVRVSVDPRDVLVFPSNGEKTD